MVNLALDQGDESVLSNWSGYCRADPICRGTEVGKSMALPCDGPELGTGALQHENGDPGVHPKEFEGYPESSGEPPGGFKKIWKTSDNGRIG